MSHEQDHPNYPSVDQSDRTLPRNLRQTGDPGIEMLVSTRVRKSPFFDKSFNENGAWRCTVYNRLYHPRGLVEPEDGGAMAEYEALTNSVTIWDVAVERQIRVKGPDAEALTNHVVTRDVSSMDAMDGKYVILCNEDGGVLNDPVLLRPAEDEFWFSISDNTLMQWLQGVNVGMDFDVEIDEIDVAPMQIQGPLSEDVMVDVVGDEVSEIPYYGLMESQVDGVDVLISQTGFSGEKGFEIYVKEASKYGERVWDQVHESVLDHGGMQIAPGHHRRIAAGIMSWGQDLDHETSPFQVNLGYHVPDDKDVDYIGKEALEEQKEQIENGNYPFNHKMIGMKMAGEPIHDYAPDFWLVSDPDSGDEVGYLTSPWYNPDLETNIGMGFVPAEMIEAETDVPLNDSVYDEDLDLEFEVHLPDEYAEEPGEPVFATAAKIPFKESVNPSAREQAKLSAKQEASSND
ncbi:MULTISPECIES: glycine cleavage system protein T [unclassified Halorubrum]|uniref:glycine cleavage system protein T n=1 Tax=unclassified Halorubrum TaxID=2642239 RepID=UPI000B99894B|nr:glycine cleavage system protein T [Halorubrum sp. Hd13]OYR43540.1 glycine cleavage system protein T [Halorubrum sp. Hd13]OYR44908.1 glycine cleavage system protein T [Halorubrum sp. Ea8]OYR47275.1 glycine cleavage system protein T [Halorubrum sp. Eb13]OYR55058.1 glycine cleavage system protein T [Halorubrum sp. Ea1]